MLLFALHVLLWSKTDCFTSRAAFLTSKSLAPKE